VLLFYCGCTPSDSPAGTDSHLSTTNSQPPPRWTNSLGMVFVPVPGARVRFCIWETRVQDFATFVHATGYDATEDVFSLAEGGWVQDGHTWKNPGFEQGPTHPVTAVSWDDAKAFCAWLTGRDRKAGLIQTNQAYRLPMDAEWSAAIGLTNELGKTPQEKVLQSSLYVYPWGPKWPPPQDFANYPQRVGVDRYPFTAPVGAFPANAAGLFDLSGNVWEWCEDFYAQNGSWRVYRGWSFTGSSPENLESWARGFGEPNERYVNRGFRVVLTSAL
jgi:formylglycine-generating enzyme required for sulfatase activity